jgi:hypothetical protein
MVPVLWLIDRSGPHAMVQAEVVRTHLWRHRPPDGRPHTHSNATLLIQGLNEVYVPRADNLEKGDRVEVLVRLGRLTGWPYFVELAEAGPGEPLEGAPGLLPEEEVLAPPEAEAEPGPELEPEPALEPLLEEGPGPAEGGGEGPG